MMGTAAVGSPTVTGTQSLQANMVSCGILVTGGVSPTTRRSSRGARPSWRSLGHRVGRAAGMVEEVENYLEGGISPSIIFISG